ncbi:ATPase, T2SS/T4P/T4SS family (plasmid) [Nitratidesulfovibrio vulgaris]|jgi:type II secretory ATPase GspE/PulE/Tfp pilus assembly ATPase PilB-like protein|nr:ATPase, T2SS/T4P/T4SS family [Nitratidesulfovibrio vulgaris]WCB48138.1 ATPase, T2SS/T4P/T4SS family [Nitratidesulfovibrio vulgaris]
MFGLSVKQQGSSVEPVEVGGPLCTPPSSIAKHVFIDGTPPRVVLYVSEELNSSVECKNYAQLLKQTNRISGVVTLKRDEFKERKKSGRDVGELAVRTAKQQEAADIFSAAAKRGASDIHIDEYKSADFADIRFRINGRLGPYLSVTSENARSLLQTIYNTLCGTQAESNYQEGKFQDGHIASAEYLPRGVHGIRVVSGAHSDGAYMVLRLLYDNTETVSGSLYERLTKLGYSEGQARMIDHMRSRPSGLVLVGGPTGSGKSTTLKHVFECWALDRPDLLIMTAEDPVEYPIYGVRQIGVSTGYGKAAGTKQGVDHSDVLRVALRSDPDVLLIGEVRDRDSASYALQAAQTGHPTWGTIHGNSAWSLLHRFVGMLSTNHPEKILDVLADQTVLTGLVYQHLVATLCPHCKRLLCENEDAVPPALLRRIKTVCAPESSEYRNICIEGDGPCEACLDTHISGRTVCAEVVLVDPLMLDLLRKDDHGVEAARTLWQTGHSGQTYLDHALAKMFRGEISPAGVESKLGPLNMVELLRDGTLDKDELATLGDKPSSEEV